MGYQPRPETGPTSPPRGGSGVAAPLPFPPANPRYNDTIPRAWPDPPIAMPRPPPTSIPGPGRIVSPRWGRFWCRFGRHEFDEVRHSEPYETVLGLARVRTAFCLHCDHRDRTLICVPVLDVLDLRKATA